MITKHACPDTWKETQVLKVIAASYSTIKKLCENTEQSQSATEEEEEVEGLVCVHKVCIVPGSGTELNHLAIMSSWNGWRLSLSCKLEAVLGLFLQ